MSQRYDKAVKEVYEAVYRIQSVQDELNAVVSLIDPASQLAELKRIPESATLYGVPVVVKDNISTKGIRTTASSRMLADYVPVYDATVIERLHKAGAVIIAKSAMDELGMGGTSLSAATGPIHNPYDPQCIAGGSSGGSAVLVACGAVPLAIGTDTGDSIRKPASYNNIIGVKPTYGRISRYGVIAYASSLDHVGFFTRDISMAARALNALAGRDERDMTSSSQPVPDYGALLSDDIRGKRIALLGNVYDCLAENEWKQTIDRLIRQLREKGALVKKEYMDKDLMEAILPVYIIIANGEACMNDACLDGVRYGLEEVGNTYQQMMSRSRTDGFSRQVRKRMTIGAYALSGDHQETVMRKAQKVRRLIVQEQERILRMYDAILSPACSHGAPKIKEVRENILARASVAENYLAMANFSGYPSMSVPAGFLNGMPVGLVVTCRPFAEAEMFTFGQAIEECTGLKDAVRRV